MITLQLVAKSAEIVWHKSKSIVGIETKGSQEIGEEYFGIVPTGAVANTASINKAA